VRITKHPGYEALNYNRWEVCAPACKQGKQLGISVFEFVKEALIRKYGTAWCDQLESAAEYKNALIETSLD
jgi:hypothetical protein